MNRIFENTSSLFFAQLIGRIFSLSLTLLLATYFRETELGQYFLAISITNMIASIAELGMHAPFIREVTLNLQQARHFIGNALIIRLFLSIVAFGGNAWDGASVRVFTDYFADDSATRYCGAD